jgi:hypothetical protein
MVCGGTQASQFLNGIGEVASRILSIRMGCWIAGRLEIRGGRK